MTSVKISGLDRQVCPPCREEQWWWLNTRPQDMFRELGYITQARAGYDATPAGIRDNRKVRFERWRTLVRDQIVGIADDCRRNEHNVI